MRSYSDIVIALAGICQSASLVPQLAHKGTCDAELYKISIKSILNVTPISALDVFGEITNIKTGLILLDKILKTAHAKEQMDVLRYILGSLTLSNKLRKNPDALNELSKRLARIRAAHNTLVGASSEEDALSYTLAGIYADIISPLTTKIRVTGKVEYLQNTLTQAKVRTALFACVRAGMLWYQVQGNRWQFIFSRQKLIKTTQALLASS